MHVPDLLIGLETPDDAAVWRLGGGRVLVVTTDFFTPVVDTPYEYGAIAAANSLSDVYAMGAAPFAALIVAALPPDLPVELSREIIRGLAEKTAEAGAVVVGGHTIQDKEPKVGLVGMGFVQESSLLRKNGLRVGDRLVLSKPLGFGVLTTTIKQQKADPEDIDEVLGWMERLNRDAAMLAVEYDLKAATDITGFSFLGHGWEMAEAAGVGFRVNFERIPFVSGAKKYAQAWSFPGGAFDNKLYFGSHVDFAPEIPEEFQMLLFDPQTSGGLLIGVPEEEIDGFMTEAQARNIPVWDIGEVVPGDRITIMP
jgi:selenide,water dikinase